MKKKNLFVAGAAVIAVAGALTFGSIQTFASATAEEEAKQIAVKYLDAVEDRNAEEAVKYVEDVRFPDEASLLAAYKQMNESSPVTNIAITDIKKKNSKHVDITIEYVTSEGEKDSSVLPMVKEDAGWKVVYSEIKEKPAKK
ncbi:hypothetical protein CBW65_11325 [Tumebacillus avium]|uniref:Uncharacterized protein n=1 Tax=Tumebacillus avium TaxID=1903704 RepID=A0A1Y0IQB4_9BACL|nr:DUF4878 domain-containing protein [Tumebacillus avium]ARU61534.1 hypothetical protein CBW65_11325 [Tumebacillus avium]